MNLFYCKDIKGSTAQLSAGESQHCIKVLRHHKGDHIMVTDGKGGLCEAVITTDSAVSCSIEVLERMPLQAPLPGDIHIAIAPTKNMDRYEYFLEKTTELGISKITPLICQRSERRILKTERLRKVILSAMKQSFSTILPELSEPVSLTDFLAGNGETKAIRLIAHCAGSERHQVKDVYASGSDVIFLIGPEGDFSPEEIQLSHDHGFIPVTLGRNRLRTETAGLVACHTIHLLNEIQD